MGTLYMQLVIQKQFEWTGLYDYEMVIELYNNK